ncbi:penicillin acylase family protein [uncultured Nisaea sp.]|uniref:penicillin acylase family protein n=1 Tax=uncultured Nisaea sp. TaxID=538215 RepID=UPI0030EC21A5|tara:strand:- start:429 stop:2843 length:2415 start_codon:yes stop_codon:yes gene_type:complete
MLGWGKRLGLGLLFVFVGLNFGCAALLIWLSGSVPEIDGEINLPGLSAPVTVTRDSVGVPVIRAASDEDAYFALGYAHAQDRLWQMESMRRLGAGRMAEMVGTLSASIGETVLPFDRITRGFGFYRLAEASYERASPALKMVLERYADGVNAYLSNRQGALPIEFEVLFHEPEPWKPADSLVWQQLMAFQLGGNWPGELARLRMLETGLTPEQIAFLYQDADGTLPAVPHLRESALAPGMLGIARQFAAALPFELSPGGASNAWALSGDRTTSGKPLLANDPHLHLTNPNLWYLARIETPSGILAGATVPGVPFMVLGHNGNVAWGFTTPHVDTQDLFIETVDPADPARYLTPSGSRPFETRAETFRIGSREVTETFRSTRHGPVISDTLNSAKRNDEKTVIALASPSFLPGDTGPEGVLELNRSRTLPEALAALEKFSGPAQNVTLADRDGNIALAFAGRVPARGGSGMLPADGLDPDADWQGWVVPSRLPLTFNPDDGLVVQANDRVAPRDPALYLGPTAEPPVRADRIRDRIEAMSDAATTAQQVALQMDALSTAAREVSALLLERLKPDLLTPAELDAAERLRAWDGTMNRNRAEPLIYSLWTALLHQRIFGDDLGDLIGEYRRPYPHMFRAVLTGDTSWCDDIRTDNVEPCATLIRESLQEAVARLTTKYGQDASSWRWGKSHTAKFQHLLWSRIPQIDSLLGTEIATDGGDFTVNRGGPSIRISETDFSFHHVHGAGLRAVYDLADLDESLFSLSLGQSGNPFSEYYHDQAEDWADGRYRPLNGIPDPGAHILTLRPE